ncbi:MAG: tyrosine-protein phosphatase [Clostridia bacterium]|nr:tyrosine-protein phosphatase [Clostridia bacterium]
MVRLISPEDGYLFDTHTDLQNTFIKKIHTDGTDEAHDFLTSCKNGAELSYPRTLTLIWEDDGADAYTVEVSETDGFDAPFLTVTTTDTSCEIENLKIGQTYFWRVSGGEVRSFTTKADAPRFIHIDGAKNARDIGGGKIRQGLLYRGSELERCLSISEAGKHTFTDVLGIKTELDLRLDMLGKIDRSAAGDAVSLVQIPNDAYLEIFKDEYRKGIVRAMDFFANEENYPVYFHCLIGADRTGMIALYLRAIAGENDAELLTDYQMTSLTTVAQGEEGSGGGNYRKTNSSWFAAFLDELKKTVPGETLAERILAYLLSCGVTEAQLDKIRSIIKK